MMMTILWNLVTNLLNCIIQLSILAEHSENFAKSSPNYAKCQQRFPGKALWRQLFLFWSAGCLLFETEAVDVKGVK